MNTEESHAFIFYGAHPLEALFDQWGFEYADCFVLSDCTTSGPDMSYWDIHSCAQNLTAFFLKTPSRLVTLTLLLHVQCVVDFLSAYLLDGCWLQLSAPWSSEKEICAGAGRGFQESSIYTCLIMAWIEAPQCSLHDRMIPIVENVSELIIVFTEKWSFNSLFVLI